MTARRLLNLYPRRWRARYGEEFLETVGNGRLRPQQVVDIISSAVDAWLSADVRHATRPASAAIIGRGTMTLRTMVCGSGTTRYTPRDGLIGAAVMIGLTSVFAIAATAAKRYGWPITSEVLLNLGFSVPVTLSMPFWLMKGQPWKAQCAIVGGTVLVLAVISYVAVL